MYASIDNQQTIMGCKTQLFANSGTLRTDDCATELRDKTNAIYGRYNVWNARPSVCDDAGPQAFAACHPSLWYKQGVGNIDPCYVDNDSSLRNPPQWQMERRRYQLFPREFQAVPGVANGDFIPDVDSFLSRGAVQQRDKRVGVEYPNCKDISEIEKNNNFIPMIPYLQDSVQDPTHIVPPWTNGGVASRIMYRKKICDA